MTLGRQNVLIALFVAIPAALIIFTAVSWLERRDRVALLERIAQAQLNEVSRDACQNDPQWFLAGPRTGRPSPEERLQPDADVRLPRPKSDELPFEYFAYDEEFSPKSVAGSKFPDDMKRAFRRPDAPRVVTSTFAGKLGSGLQTAVATGWTPGPCSYLLFRQPGPPGVALSRAALFGGIFVVCALVAWLSTAPTTMRIRRLSREAKHSSAHDYSEMVKISGSDEISSLGAVYNDAAVDIRQRVTDAADRELALRRYVETTTEDVVPPMQALERQLSSAAASAAGADMRGPVRETHRLMMMLQNLAAVTRLRAVHEGTPRETVDLTALVRGLVEDRAALAAACDVHIDVSKAGGAVTVQADFDLMRQAVANLIDNAIVYNRPGGVVRLDLASYDHGKRFRLVVADNGPGVPDDTFAGLTANKRFRGDESRNRRPDSRGLGLALAREIADRFGMQLDLRQPADGGFEAEFTTRTRA
jgi:signal transduction histidine kinase